MRHAMTAGLAACALCIGASLALADPPAADFPQTIGTTRAVLTVRDGRASGPGADYLLRRATESRFVLVGEEHGVATIADTVRAVSVSLREAGYRHLAVESDPWTARILERELRAGGLRGYARWLGEEGHRIAIPFYNWSAEAALAQSVVDANRDATPALWGLDQVFIGAFGPLLEAVASEASSAPARELAGSLARQARGDMAFLAKVAPDAFERLRAELAAPADEARARLVDAMILSARIYAPFIDRPGLSPYAANLERENLMKRQFLEYYRAAGAPKVLFKFGANHMARGLSPTHVPSLGSFLTDLALGEGGSAFNLLVLCGPGTRAGDFQGDSGSCEIDVQKSMPEVAAQLDATQPTLFDLAPWKDAPKQWAHLPEEVRALLWAYDAVLFVPDGKPARILQ